MRAVSLVVVAGVAAVLLGCGGNHPPALQPLSDKTASVGVELTFEVRATDAEGDPVSFDFDCPGIPDLKTRTGDSAATLSVFSDGVAVFRWVPSAMDRNTQPWACDFRASDGKSTSTETVQITVVDGSGTSPIFRKPLGTGTTLDLATASCVDVPILVEDQDSTMVTLGQDDPVIDGATLDQTGAFEGTWHFCPTPAQIAAQDRYMLTLSADDGTSAPAKKQYLIVLRRNQTNCGFTGNPPAIMHTAPGAQSTVADIPITATITDDKGVKSALLYYSTTAPAATPDLSQMVQVSMTRTAGTTLSGTWTGTIPNPVATAPAGTMKTLYYVITADDNDDPTGLCNHTTEAPTTGTYSVAVTNPGATNGAGVCAACTADSQCGGANDNCITIGGGSYCSRACGGAFPNCPNGYNCSTNAVTSVNGASARQCLPTSGTCVMVPSCTDDSYEQNDTVTNIANAMSANFTPGTVMSLALCNTPTGTVDEDWYGINATVSSVVDMKTSFLVGSGYSDLDLQLTDASGNVLDRSYGITSTEEIVSCWKGKRFLRVFTFDTPPVNPNLYDLTVSVTPDDPQEPNDDASTASDIFTGPLSSPLVINGLQICAGNEDWFDDYYLTNDVVTIDLTFTSTSSADDLDIHFYKSDKTTDLATSTNGLGTGSNAHFQITIPADGFYYIAVKGKTTSSANTYTFKATYQ